MTQKVCLSRKEWFIETPLPGTRRYKLDAFKISRNIYKGKTPFQEIHIFESKGFGRILALDGIIQFSQSDEFIYHEMITHVPLLSHPHPKRFLIIGGGDGGVLREAVKHPLKEIYHVELDKDVVSLCRRYIPFVSKGAFSDKRIHLTFADGQKFIQKYKNFFDVIIVDSTDPVGPGKVLFGQKFYNALLGALTPDGIAVFQMGALLDFSLLVKPYARKLKKLFWHLSIIRLPMPSYSCGCEYSFLMASRKVNPAGIPLTQLYKRFTRRLGQKGKTLRYYTPPLHLACQVMPKLWQLSV